MRYAKAKLGNHLIFVITGVAVLIVFVYLVLQQSSLITDGTPVDTDVFDADRTSEKSFLLNEVGYECSKEIEGEWKEAAVGQLAEPGYYFYPADQEEFETYCRESYVIEYHAVLEVLKFPDVREVLDRHHHTLAWVKVLNYQLIEDTEYIQRILPAYSDLAIHCIVVMHSPEGERFWVEIDNGDGHYDYMEIPSQEFSTSLNNAPLEDVHRFWLNLR